MPNPSLTYIARRLVEFRETDAAGIMHFTAFFGLMEESEHEFLRYLGLPLFRPTAEGKISWPRVSASCDFKSPAKFEDELAIAVAVDSMGTKSVTYAFDFRCGDRHVAAGKMTAVCCLVKPDGQVQAVAIPAEVIAKLTPYMSE